MANNAQLTAAQRRKKFVLELKDMLAGAAFPFMLAVILSVTVIGFCVTDELALGIVILVAGELFLLAAYLVFGRQNGVAAARKSAKNIKKRELGSADAGVLFKTGEYALYKAFIIGLISCVPFILIQFINCVFLNNFCGFLLRYAFGWAYYPLSYLNLSQWLSFIWILPLVSVHAAGYVWGARQEFSKQAVTAAQEQKSKNKKSRK